MNALQFPPASFLWNSLWQTTLCLLLGAVASLIWSRRPARSYSILLLEGYSRKILAGTVSYTKGLVAVLAVLYSAMQARGLPIAPSKIPP